MAKSSNKTKQRGRNIFAEVPTANISRSSFDRSHGLKTTFDGGELVPIFVDEVLPGDTFNLRTQGFVRMATPIFPVMDNLYISTHYFFVPYRLVWDNWQKMMGEQESPGDSTDYLVPQMVSQSASGYDVITLQCHLGVPPYVKELSHSALPIRAYHLIWNEWFRDQNLQQPYDVPKGDGPDQATVEQSLLKRRGKRHDYFTSALPWPQKGPDVTLPLGTQADVLGIGVAAGDDRIDAGGGTSIWHRNNPDGYYAQSRRISGDDTSLDIYVNMRDTTGNPAIEGDYRPNIYADLTTATAATVNQLRESFQIQKMYERDARGGTRYTEIVKSHFGVTSPDARLQRPEFLGGGQSPINVSPIHATAESGQTGSERPIGALSAIATASVSGHGFTKSFTEHGIIIGLASVRADLTYQNGLNRMWSRKDRFDFYWPSFQGLGEQEVYNKEIFAQGLDNPTADEQVFGYQERYAEYRYRPSEIHGKFHSMVTGSLDAWHLAQKYGNLPTLGEDFIKDDPPIDRVVAVTDEPHFIADFYHRLYCARPMPMYGIPGGMDRF